MRPSQVFPRSIRYAQHLITVAAAEGGLPPDIHDRLQQRPHLVDQIVKCLLDDNWASTFHQEILDAVGVPPGERFLKAG